MLTAAAIYDPFHAHIAQHFGELAVCRSTPELQAHPLYRRLAHSIHAMLNTVDTGGYARGRAPARPAYRVVAWNIERGIQLEGQLCALQTDAYLAGCDVLLLTEADMGMARSGNRAVAQEMARALGFYYAFAPCYLNLTKGSGIEAEVRGENQLGLHGNAILSRYPFRNVRAIPLRNGIDKMASREKRIGCQKALAVDIDFPGFPVTAVAVHLDAQSTQRHRRAQMRDVIRGLDNTHPVVLGGDWNTSTYNSSRALWSCLGYCLRVLMGVENVIRNHYLHPYRHFEKGLFRLLERHGFDYRRANVPGEPTAGYDISDTRATRGLADWMPGWCFAFIRWALRNHGGRCPLKLDWLATRGLGARHPVVLHEFREGRAVPLSDHDPLGIDILAQSSVTSYDQSYINSTFH